MPRAKMKLLGGNSNPDLWDSVSTLLKQKLSPCTVSKFANGETNVIVNETVRQSDVYIMQSGFGDISVNDSCMEIVILGQACSMASARRVTAVLPYFPYSKQSKQKKRGTIVAKLIADLLRVAGFNHILTLDLHHMQMQGFFSMPVDNVKCSPLIADYIKLKIPGGDKAVIAAKNAGASKRAAVIAKRLSTDFSLVFGEQTKYAELLSEEKLSGDGSFAAAFLEARDGGEHNDLEEGQSDDAHGNSVIGSVEGRDVIIVDDLIDHAEPFVHAARLFREHGCRKVYVVATHGLMSEDCPELLQACDEIERVTVTNTIPQQKHMEKCAKLDVIDCSDVLAEAMRRLHFNESLYGMYAPAAPAVSTLRRASFRHSRSRGLSSSAAAPDE